MFKLQIDTGNAAFDPDPEFELARLLRNVANEAEFGKRTSGDIFDINGNPVGTWKLTMKKGRK